MPAIYAIARTTQNGDILLKIFTVCLGTNKYFFPILRNVCLWQVGSIVRPHSPKTPQSDGGFQRFQFRTNQLGGKFSQAEDIIPQSRFSQNGSVLKWGWTVSAFKVNTNNSEAAMQNQTNNPERQFASKLQPAIHKSRFWSSDRLSV